MISLEREPGIGGDMVEVAAMDPLLSDDPFVMPLPPEVRVPHDAPEGSYSHEVVAASHALTLGDLDTAALSVEVKILWDRAVLHVAHLTPPRPFHVGEGEGEGRCDYVLPASKLGAARAPIVLVDGGAVFVVIPPRATGVITLPGEADSTVAQAIEAGRAEPCAEPPGAHRIALPPGAKARVEVDDLVFEVASTHAGRAAKRAPLFSSRGLAWGVTSMIVHLTFLGAHAVVMPPTDGSEERASEQRRDLIRHYLATAEVKEQESREAEQPVVKADVKPGDGKHPALRCADLSVMYQQRLASRDPEEFRLYTLREPFLEQMNRILGQSLPDLRELGEVATLPPRVADVGLPYIADVRLGGRCDSWGPRWDGYIDARDRLPDIGEEASGPPREVSGLRSIELLGLGADAGAGRRFLADPSLFAAANVRRPRVRLGGAVISGRRSPEAIDRAVRPLTGRFRACYQHGLRNNPALSGRVMVHFVIGRDGAVSNVSSGGSAIVDSCVLTCVAGAFYGLSFPPSEIGPVTGVLFPIFLGGGS
jgi:hypothetical protein